MTNKELYQSAMGKVSPGEGWQADTLAKLAAARAEAQNSPAPAEPKTPFKVWRKALVPLAAAAAVFALAVGTNLLPGGGGYSSAAPEAAAAQEPAAMPYMVQQDTAGAAENGDVPLGGQAEAGERKSMDKKSAVSFDQGTYNGLPVLVWGNDASGGAGCGPEFWAQKPEELNDGNPTYNLPAHQLPTSLPVWRAVSGEGAEPLLTGQLKNLGQLLKLELTLEQQPSLGQGYPYPQLDPYSWYATAPRDAVSSWQLDVSGTQARALAQNNYERDWGDKAAFAAGDKLALTTVNTLKNPAHVILPSYTYEGKTTYEWFRHYYYEAGSAADPIATKLYNYTFKRVAGTLDQNGALDGLYLTTEPKTEKLGDYPLRSLDEAKLVLQRRLAADGAADPTQTVLTLADVTSWRIEYDQSPMNAYIQPVYVFTLEKALTEAEQSSFTQLKGYTRYVEYRVSALPEEYCIDWQEHFN